MAWTTPATVVTGQLMTAAIWNQQVRDNFSFLKTVADASLTAESGTYTGNGTSDRTISLTSTPKLVAVSGGSLAMFTVSNVTGGTAGLFSVGGGSADASSSINNNTRPLITTDGFIVSGSTSGALNETSGSFQYTAIL